MEWSRPFDEAEPGHRHVSHLYGLIRRPVQLREDARVDGGGDALEHRLANGGGHTG